ncbi:MAG TPA: PA14 domain-containing protein [Aliidongia sp.]|uniref:PA14 domain-containing protein n=1 Tax=Aliidongia sp. TaxID=1914230 RepID=UPI002DDCFC8D|nr:PA14 domain-containing protein [Aliidongia sp.]HEV2673823.1 PA14 domain-containing protein [Aliidongia sp.]
MVSGHTTWRAVSAAVLFLLTVFAGPGARAQGVAAGGFLGNYYANLNLTGVPAFQRRDARLDFAWTGQGVGGSTAPGFVGTGTAGFSASWTGSLIPATSETYTFSIGTTGAIAVYIRPTHTTSWKTLIADWGGGARTRQASDALIAGQSYDLLIYYWQYTPTGALQLSWGSPTLPLQVVDAAVPLGIDLAYVSPNDPALIFADAARQALPFQRNQNYMALTLPAPVAADGWPATDATLPLWTEAREPEGTYQVSFDGLAQVVDWQGVGHFSVGGTAYGTVLPAGVGYDPASNRTSAQWTILAPAATGGAYLGFVSSQRSPAAAVGSGIANLHVMRPSARGSAASHPDGSLFTADLKRLVAGFTVIRLMDYLATDANNQRHWADRVTPLVASQYQTQPGYGWQGKGAAWEYGIELANETGKDLWINVPLQVDDDYVTRLAQLLRYGGDGTNPYASAQAAPVFPPLNANLRVYVEYSNELWNSAFIMNQQNVTLALSAVAAGGSPLNYDGATDSRVLGQRRAAERTKEISDLFRTVWGDAGMMTRIRPVLEWQYGNAQAGAQNALGFLEAYWDNADGRQHVATPYPVSRFLWGGGGAWYATLNDTSQPTVGGMFGSGIALDLPATTRMDGDWARSFGLHETGYEGGFFVGESNLSSPAQNALQDAANIDPAAAAAETQSINLFFQYGGELPMVFTTSSETYGMIYPTVHEQALPKLAGIAAATSRIRPLPSVGLAVPATLNVVDAAISDGTLPSLGLLTATGDYVGWTVNLAAAGSYSIRTDAIAPGSQQILVDGALVGADGWSGALSAGLHAIRIRNGGSGVLLQNLLVTQP